MIIYLYIYHSPTQSYHPLKRFWIHHRWHRLYSEIFIILLRIIKPAWSFIPVLMIYDSLVIFLHHIINLHSMFFFFFYKYCPTLLIHHPHQGFLSYLICLVIILPYRYIHKSIHYHALTYLQQFLPMMHTNSTSLK